MNTFQKVAACVLTGLLLVVGAFAYQFLHPPTRSFAPLVGVTRIKAFDAQGRATVIGDPGRIASICAFVNRYPNHWGGAEDVFGVPVPGSKVDLYAGQTFLGHFGAGSEFFETQRDGDFASRPASDSEVSTFRQLVRGEMELIAIP